MFSHTCRPLDDGELGKTFMQKLQSVEVAGAIFQQDSDVLGRDGLDEEERDFRDRVG